MSIEDEVISQVRSLQRKLDELTDALGISERGGGDVPDEVDELVRSVSRFRSKRRALFRAELFGEPAWDMLLELYQARLAARSESVSSLCLASGVPPTTALRWLKALEMDGWARLRAHPRDSGRFFVEMTHKGLDAMDRLLAEAPLKLAPE